MQTANAQLQDWAIGHEHDLRRFSNGVVQRMLVVLDQADESLARELANAIDQLGRQSLTAQRLDTLLASVRALNESLYNQLNDAIQAEMHDLSEVEATAQTGAMRASIPAQILVRFPVAAVSAETVYAAALSRPFQGKLLREWAQNLDASRMAAIRNTIRQGFVQGETTDKIIRSIRGTRAMNYRDGILERSRRELSTVVQTALSHTAQTARQQLVEANADIVSAEQWVSTLDTRTSPMCRVRDGLKYSADGSHKPIGHSIPWGDGPGRLHFNCRSVSVPVLKSWRDLGIDAADMSPGTRASMDGQVPADLTYRQWFERQTAARQEDVLGPARYALYKEGRVSVDGFWDNRGRWLTLDQLRARAVGN